MPNRENQLRSVRTVVVDTGAVYRIVCAVVHVVVAIQQPYPRHPVVGFFGPVAIRAVTCVSGETGGELEETAVRDGGFVVESGVWLNCHCNPPLQVDVFQRRPAMSLKTPWASSI